MAHSDTKQQGLQDMYYHTGYLDFQCCVCGRGKKESLELIVKTGPLARISSTLAGAMVETEAKGKTNMRSERAIRFFVIVWCTAATSIAFIFAGLLFFGLLVPRKDKVAPNYHERHGSSIVPVQYLLISQMAEAAKKYSEIKVIEEKPPVSPFYGSYGIDTKDGLTVVTGSLPFVLNHGDVPTIDSEIVENLLPSIGKFVDFRFTGIREIDSLSKQLYGIKEADRAYYLDFRWQAYLMDPFETYDLRVNR